MAEYLYNARLVSWALEKRRKARVSFMLSKVDTWPGMSILDVGCGRDGRSFENYVSGDYRITGVDILVPERVTTRHPHFEYCRQDARDSSRFASRSFDLAVSIGMMEHICEQGRLRQIANEIMRVSKQWVVVVPWEHCPIEPHVKFPFFQLMPRLWQCCMTKAFSLHDSAGEVSRDPTWIARHYQWLSTKAWKRLFEADRVYVTPTLDTIAIVKRDPASRGTMADPSAMSDSRACVMSE